MRLIRLLTKTKSKFFIFFWLSAFGLWALLFLLLLIYGRQSSVKLTWHAPTKPPCKYLLKYAELLVSCVCISFACSPSFCLSFFIFYKLFPWFMPASLIWVGEGERRVRCAVLFILRSFLLALLARSTKLEVGKLKSNCRSLISCSRVPSVCIQRIPPPVNRASLWNSASFHALPSHRWT